MSWKFKNWMQKLSKIKNTFERKYFILKRQNKEAQDFGNFVKLTKNIIWGCHLQYFWYLVLDHSWSVHIVIIHSILSFEMVKICVFVQSSMVYRCQLLTTGVWKWRQYYIFNKYKHTHLAPYQVFLTVNYSCQKLLHRCFTGPYKYTSK